MMWVEIRRWIRRHGNVAVSFAIGISFGVSIVALAYFSSKSEVVAQMVRHGVQATGHADLDEDLIWFLGGVAAGAGVACYAWWRESRARVVGLESENVLNRITADPRLRIVARSGNARHGPAE